MKRKNEVHATLLEFIKANPTVTYTEMAKQLGCSISTISSIAIKAGHSRKNTDTARLTMADLAALEVTNV